MQNLIINSKSRIAIEAYLAMPGHALLLVGPEGVGLGTIADNIAKIIAGANTAKITPKTHKAQKTVSINIDDIQEIHKIVRNRQKRALAVVIDETDKMTFRTPEALLKLLEEPGDNIFFILTTHNIAQLPMTILSRTQKIEILPASNKDCQSLMHSVKAPARRQQIEFLAGGLPAEISRLIENEEYFRSQARNFELAKQFISGKAFDRLRLISGVKTRDDAAQFLGALAKLMMILSTKQVIDTNLALVSDTQDNVAQNGNIRAQLTNLAVNML